MSESRKPELKSTVQSLRDLARLFDRRQRIHISGVSLMLLIGSCLEVLGIGLVFPFLNIVSRPELALESPSFGPLLHELGVTTSTGIILWASLIVLCVVLFKAIYLLIQWRVSFRFFYGQTSLLSQRLLRAYLMTPYTFHLQRNSAELIRNTNIETSNIAGVLKICAIFGSELTVMSGLLVLVVMMDFQVGIVTVGALVVIGWTMIRVFRGRLAAGGKS